MSTTALRRRVQDDDGVIFTEHPSGRWVMEADPDSYRRLIDTWDSYEQLLGDAVELTELEPAPAYTDDEIGDEWRADRRVHCPRSGCTVTTEYEAVMDAHVLLPH